MRTDIYGVNKKVQHFIKNCCIPVGVNLGTLAGRNQIISSRNGVREERQHGGKYYGSTTQHAGDERQQNAQRNNINTG